MCVCVCVAQVLVELSAAGTHEEVLDLTGDAGAVGRVVVEGRAGTCAHTRTRAHTQHMFTQT